MALDNRFPPLGCGRTVNRIWLEMYLPPDPHTRTCPDCRTARKNMEDLYAATDALRDHDLRHPGLRPPHGLKEAVLHVALAQARRGIRLPLAETLRGSVEINDVALAGVVREAARDLGGVRARRCLIDQVPGADSGLLIHLRTAVAPGVDIRRTMAFLRLRIRDAVEASVGIVPHTVHLTVEDLYDD
ncbi:hypothetical protein ABIB35_002432 [Arthrobacter sp. UYP6]|uniref:hypothetical protein n=1 Tax=Arthrobacter sp. UYP6 TaxID=1756378 RepID=UPI0033955EF0